MLTSSGRLSQGGPESRMLMAQLFKVETVHAQLLFTWIRSLCGMTCISSTLLVMLCGIISRLTSSSNRPDLRLEN